MGAQWVHGEGNAVWELAHQRELLSDIISAEGEGLYLREDGVAISLGVVQEVSGEVARILEECENFALDLGAREDHPCSIGQHLNTRFRDYLDHCDCDEEGRQQRLQLLDWHIRPEGSIKSSVSNHSELTNQHHSLGVTLLDSGLHGLGRQFISICGRGLPLKLRVPGFGNRVGITYESDRPLIGVCNYSDFELRAEPIIKALDQDRKFCRFAIFELPIMFHVIDNSCTRLDQLSAKAFGNYCFTGGKDYMNFKQGYSSLVQSLADDLPTGMLRLNCPVEMVDWQGVSIVTRNVKCEQCRCYLSSVNTIA
ncbi:unnamed protein product, partial [Timema podura]|nr:unnamed protein product [Timema podura]